MKPPMRKFTDGEENRTASKVKRERPPLSEAKVIPRGTLGRGIEPVTPKDKKRGKGIQDDD